MLEHTKLQVQVLFLSRNTFNLYLLSLSPQCAFCFFVKSSTKLCAAARVFINVLQYPISHKKKNSLNLGLKQWIVDTVTLKHSK